jgi:frataxin-like iron-binding protein CyaY
LAAKSGGFHFKLDGEATESIWRNTVSGESLIEMLTAACLAQSGEQVNFDF